MSRNIKRRPYNHNCEYISDVSETHYLSVTLRDCLFKFIYMSNIYVKIFKFPHFWKPLNVNSFKSLIHAKVPSYLLGDIRPLIIGMKKIIMPPFSTFD